MKSEDKKYVIDYYYNNFVSHKGIIYNDYIYVTALKAVHLSKRPNGEGIAAKQRKD